MAAAIFAANAIEGMRPSAPVGLLDISLTGPTSYATGGITGAAALLSAAAVAAGYKHVFTKDNIFGIVPLDCKGYHIAYNKADDKFVWYYGNNDGGSDGPAVEVAAATNLDAITVRFTVLFA